ncbi:DUF6325 family protein [Virgisporangium aurantiacum]|uniref:DUF1269 domain-containing family protein n=1 Tax=Virgisporangium aurantiacum TaxID=175570 RepID=A0A8J3Z8L4_9ACTN|nr:DUF6325 family protein [Virgisporangium aurantiacum]GIJ59524.1 DUF1269 domain-containing family protein [Virgisporangium aurantiacum]
MKGPVQVLVVGFDHPAFSGEVLAEFTRLRDAGIVRLVDLLLVSRAADGSLETLTAPDGVDAGLGGLAVALLAQRDGGGASAEPEAEPAAGPEVWSLADAIPVGTAAAVALIEHLWAGPLTAAIRRAGSTRSAETWLAPDDLALLDALIEQHAMSGHERWS